MQMPPIFHVPDILFKLYGVGQAAAFLHQFHQLVDRRRQRIRLLAQRHAAGLQVICDALGCPLKIWHNPKKSGPARTEPLYKVLRGD